jgi:hypothetical protein
MARSIAIALDGIDASLESLAIEVQVESEPSPASQRPTVENAALVAAMAAKEPMAPVPKAPVAPRPTGPVRAPAAPPRPRPTTKK